MTQVQLGPATVDLLGIRAGDENRVQLTLTADGAPINLTGQTIKAQARRTPNDATALDGVTTIIDAAAGKLALSWPGAEVAEVLGGNPKWDGWWDLQLGTDGSALTVVAGRFVAYMDVARGA